MQRMRDILIAMSVMQKGDWDGIYRMLKDKVRLTDEEVQKAFTSVDSGCVTLIDDDYPEAFKEVFKPPLTIFYKGDINLLSSKKIVSCAGARAATEYTAKKVSSLVGEALDVDSDMVLCSGMALGVDSIALREAIMRNRKIIAVAGCGIDRCYPETSRDIYDYCVSGKGLIISEYPLDVPPSRESFPFRNRLIAGLGKSLLAAQVGKRSGTSTTIRCALDYGKTILVLPQRLEEGEVTAELLRDGATPVLSGEDIARSIG